MRVDGSKVEFTSQFSSVCLRTVMQTMCRPARETPQCMVTLFGNWDCDSNFGHPFLELETSKRVMCGFAINGSLIEKSLIDASYRESTV